MLRTRFGDGKEGVAPLNGKWPLMLDPAATEGVVRSNAIDGVSRIFSLRRLPAYTSHPNPRLIGG